MQSTSQNHVSDDSAWNRPTPSTQPSAYSMFLQGVLLITAVTPQSYAAIVDSFSRLPTGIGLNHVQLANLLASLQDSHPSRSTQAVGNTFLTAYSFTQTTTPPSPSPSSSSPPPHPPHDVIDGPSASGGLQPSSSSAQKWTLTSPRYFSRPQDYLRSVVPDKAKSPGQILFLRGQASADWIGAIGAIHRVDPEFFSRGIDYPNASDRPRTFTFPALPSGGWNMIELPIVSVAEHNLGSQVATQERLNTARRESAEAMREYHNALYANDNVIVVSSSILRDVCLFDGDYLVLEQKIIICMQPPEANKGWILLVWIDAGDDMAENALGRAWRTKSQYLSSVRCYINPIIRYRPNMALTAHLLSRGVAEGAQKNLPTASTLHLDYGRSLRANVMAEDPFYALNEVFSLVNASQKQFLNLVEHKLAQYTKYREADFDALPNLRYLKEVLARRSQQIRTARACLNNAKPTRWPDAAENVSKRARTAVEQDLQSLEEQAKDLDARCQEAITVLMSTLSILDSKKAILQAERVAKLTFLAFIFVPLSFTTSFFGMNFNELVNQSIWEWFILSALISLVTLVVFFCDLRAYWNRLIDIAKDKLG